MLLRAPSSVRWQNFLPSEMMMYGEQTMLTALSRQPPTFVALVHRDASEYEAPSFGEDYARLVAGWLRQNYVELQLLGAPPFLTGDFGILLLRHRPQATSLPITR